MKKDTFTSPHKPGLKAFRVMEILQKAQQMEAQGQKVWHMEVGEPDFRTLPRINEAAAQAMAAGRTGYTPSKGLPELRAALVDFYAHFYGVYVDYEGLMLTSGASAGLDLVTRTLIKPQSKVMITDPGYPCYATMAQLLGAEVVSMPLDAETNYRVTVDLIQAYWQAEVDLVILTTPANPTGGVIPLEDLTAIAAFLASKGAYLLVDETYQGLVYDGLKPLTAAGLVEALNNVVVVNSFSKYFAMTGWRIGWLYAPKHLMTTLDQLAQNLYLAPPTLSQYAALQALSADALATFAQRQGIFAQRRDQVVAALSSIGIKSPFYPQGAFYYYWPLPPMGMDSETFATQLLAEEQVALTPGTDFGTHKADHFIRLAYTLEAAQLAEGLERLADFIQRYT